jgi:hypothetical protein
MPSDSEAVELAFEQKVDHAIQLMLSNNLNRPTLYRILQTVVDGSQRLFELEEAIQEMTEYAEATQPPYFLIEWLVDVEALSFTEVDANGEAITDEMREGKTADEVDDLIEDMVIDITDVGREVLRVYDPVERTKSVLGEHPDRYDTYVEVLEYLTERHNYAEIDALLRGRPILMSGRGIGDRPMQPSVFVDKLAAAGVIVFNKGWVITPEGRTLLQEIKSSSPT